MFIPRGVAWFSWTNHNSLLPTATNEIASFCIDNRSRQIVFSCSPTSVTHSAIASCDTFLFLPHFDVICDLLLNRRTATWNLFVLYHKETNYHKKRVFHGSKASLCPPAHSKKAIWRNLLSIQMKQSHWLLCVAKESWLVRENHAGLCQLDLRVASRGMKTYSTKASRIEFRNLKMLKRMLEK